MAEVMMRLLKPFNSYFPHPLETKEVPSDNPTIVSIPNLEIAAIVEKDGIGTTEGVPKGAKPAEKNYRQYVGDGTTPGDDYIAEQKAAKAKAESAEARIAELEAKLEKLTA